MDNQPTPSDLNQPLPQTQTTLPQEEVITLKNKTIHDFKEFAMGGTKTRRAPRPEDSNQNPYEWYDRVTTYEGENWSISFYNYDNGEWELQVTRVSTLPNGRSHSTSFTIRPENYGKFPGFQVYKEGVDETYRPAKVEEIVYLNRVVQGLSQQVSNLTN